jgi:hypothetical protein
MGRRRCGTLQVVCMDMWSRLCQAPRGTRTAGADFVRPFSRRKASAGSGRRGEGERDEAGHKTHLKHIWMQCNHRLWLANISLEVNSNDVQVGPLGGFGRKDLILIVSWNGDTLHILGITCSSYILGKQTSDCLHRHEHFQRVFRQPHEFILSIEVRSVSVDGFHEHCP